jgi:hypothetical protein
MELVDRYLHAIEFWLPNQQKHDIAAELSEEIHAQMEEQAAALGRPLTREEMEALLKRFGAPLTVAQRYLPQESLIGPTLFPIYRFVVKIIAFWLLGPWLLVGIVLALYGPTHEAGGSIGAAVAHLWGSLWSMAFLSFGMVTLVFAVLERVLPKPLLEDWSPRKLPPVRDRSRVSRLTSGFELGVYLFAVVWWAENMNSPILWWNALHVRIALSPAWGYFFWGFLVLTVGTAALSAAKLIQPAWTPVSATARLLVDGAGSVLFCWLLRAHVVAGIMIASIPAERAAEFASAVNLWMAKMFPVGVIAGVVTVCVDGVRIYRLTRGGRGDGSQRSTEE